MNDPSAYQPDQHGVYRPGNPLLEALLAGEYRAGLEVFQALERPSAEDCCWAGQCLFGLDQSLEGYELTLQACSMGLEDAGAFAATILRFTGELDRADVLLESLDSGKLSALGLAVQARERGMIAFARGARREAVTHLEQAWDLATTHPIGVALLAHFSTMLALALAKVGRDALAAKHLERALGKAKPHQLAQLHLMRALCSLYTGDLTGAQADLDSIEGLEHQGSVMPAHIRYVRGLLMRAQDLGAEAATHFLEAAALARTSGDLETEFHAEVMAGTISIDEGSISMARAHLQRAHGLIQTDQERALLGLRQGALLARLNDAEAVPVLEAALAMLEGLQLEREIGLAHLHLAEAHLRAYREDQGLSHLIRVVDLRHKLGSGAAFAAEFNQLPAVFETIASTRQLEYLHVLLEDWRLLGRGSPKHLHLTTLGGYGLSLDGREQRLESGVARSVELLAFLLHSGSATLEQIQTNVYQDVNPQNARNHFHVIRTALSRVVPALFVRFDQRQRKYAVAHPGLRLTWDAREVDKAVGVGGELGVRRALALYTGPFLPNASSEWAEIFRSDLEFSVTAAGLSALEELFKRERYEACSSLAERLLEVNPLDVGVNVLLVQATAQLRGALAAREIWAFRANFFKQQIGVVPETLLELDQSRWNQTN